MNEWAKTVDENRDQPSSRKDGYRTDVRVGFESTISIAVVEDVVCSR